MIRSWKLLGFAALLLSGWGAITSAGERIAPFELVDQHGQAVALDNSGQHTLISFYRGDW